MFSRLVLKVKRKENGFYAVLYRCAKFCLHFSIPSIKIVHLPLYYLDYSLKSGFRSLTSSLWSIPLFKARCQSAGDGLRLPNGIPLVLGSHLKIFLGDNVTIARSTIGASKVNDSPVLRIGDGSGIGYGSVISVAGEVTIGRSCMIGPHCIIMDSDDHPVSPVRRLLREAVNKTEVKPVIIGNNVWIGAYCAILKGVTIGDNSIIAAHSVITRDVAENCIYAGNPARPTMRNIDLK